ncbi:hypothetical protein AAHA92_26414 [Salvia divinorum]|uniref:Uncharacterized protein n=1 Tax=Salvia divinorum TaxID=28513 RepID=A0ABD1GEX6_SALDI
MAKDTHAHNPNPMLLEDVLSSLQCLTLELLKNRQQHVALSQRVNQLHSILGKPLVNSDPKAPMFNGTDPSGWVRKVQLYFDHFETSEEDRLWLVGLLFDRSASSVWDSYKNPYNMLSSWSEFLEAVERRFNPPRVFKVAGTVSGVGVETLISGGSTHNFIHPDAVERLGLQVASTHPFRVYVGNGASLICVQKCEKTKLLIQGHEAVVDLYVLGIHGSDVVLGVQWLESLGEVTENYADLTMKFMHNDKQVTLRGDVQNGEQVSCYAMEASFD